MCDYYYYYDQAASIFGHYSPAVMGLRTPALLHPSNLSKSSFVLAPTPAVLWPERSSQRLAGRPCWRICEQVFSQSFVAVVLVVWIFGAAVDSAGVLPRSDVPTPTLSASHCRSTAIGARAAAKTRRMRLTRSIRSNSRHHLLPGKPSFNSSNCCLQ